MKKCLTICALFMGITFAQEDPPDCPMSGRPSPNILHANYHCIADWDPCTKKDYQHIAWPTWPNHWNEGRSEKLINPLRGEVLTSPLLETGNWGMEICDEREEFVNGVRRLQGYLKPEWKVYDRELFLGDHAETEGEGWKNRDEILQAVNRIPSFSLYNTRTGILRTFALISESDHNGDMEFFNFFAEGEISNGNEHSRNFNSAFGLLENGLPSGIPLSKAQNSGFGGWTSYFESSKSRNFWWVVDQVLPYNEWDLYAGTASGVDPSVMLRYYLTVKATEGIELDGTMITEEKSGLRPPNGVFKGNQYSGAIGSLGLKKGTAQAISGSIGALSAGNGGSLLETMNGEFNVAKATQLGSYLANIAAGGGLTAGPIAASLATNLLFGGGSQQRVTWEESKISLTGTITRQGAINHAEIPMSRRNTTKLPALLKTASGLPRQDVEIGLYNFRNSPRVAVKRVDYWGDIKMPWGGYRKTFLRSEYFVNIEDPTCDLVLNTTNGNHFASLKMMPVLWDSTNSKWEYKGENQSLQNPIFYSNGIPWFISPDYGLLDDEHFKVGVEIMVQLVGEENGMARPVLSQRAFEADLIMDPNPIQVSLGRIEEIPENIPPEARAIPVFTSTPVCNVDYPIGSTIRNHVLRQTNPRNTVFEISTKTGVDDYAGTDDSIYAEITTCSATNTEQTFRYRLNNPHFDDFEKNTVASFSFSEPGEIGPIKRVRFANMMPMRHDETHPGWLLENFQIMQRKVNTGEISGMPLNVNANTWLSAEYCPFPGGSCIPYMIIGAEAHPGISFEAPNKVVYTYDVPGMESSCEAYVEREGQHLPAILMGANLGATIGKNLNIVGSHFGRSTDAVRVFLGEQEATVLRVVPEELTIFVPPMTAGRYSIKVIVNGMESSNTDAYVDIEEPPTIPPPPPTDQTPSFLSFDENPSTWHSNETAVTSDASIKVGNSGYSLSIGGEGYRVVRSKRFCASELKTYGTKLALDVYIPSNPSNPWWLGEVALFMDAPSAGVYNSWQGNVQLTGLSTGAWHTVEIPLNVQALAALSGTDCDLEFGIVINAASAGESFRIDNLHFTGTILNSETDSDPELPPTSGTGASFVCGGVCLQASAAASAWTPMTLNTLDEKWFVLNQKPSGWQASEMAGRSISANGVPLAVGADFPSAAADGKWYIRFFAGQHSWASWSQW